MPTAGSKSARNVYVKAERKRKNDYDAAEEGAQLAESAYHVENTVRLKCQECILHLFMIIFAEEVDQSPGFFL